MHRLNAGKVSGGDTIVIGKLSLIVSVVKFKLCISLCLEVVVMLLLGLVKYPTKGKLATIKNGLLCTKETTFDLIN